MLCHRKKDKEFSLIIVMENNEKREFDSFLRFFFSKIREIINGTIDTPLHPL